MCVCLCVLVCEDRRAVPDVKYATADLCLRISISVPKYTLSQLSLSRSCVCRRETDGGTFNKMESGMVGGGGARDGDRLGSWLLMNDCRAKPVSVQQVLSCEPYMLLYERM